MATTPTLSPAATLNGSAPSPSARISDNDVGLTTPSGRPIPTASASTPSSARKEAAVPAANSSAAASKPTAASTVEAKEKAQALERTVQQIEKTFGKGAIMKMDESAFAAIPGVSTGSISLDLALGGKGIPVGRIVEIFGPESSGKTTLALTIAGNVQKGGGVAAIIDAEHALDPSWARRLGVNVDNLLVSQPDTGEQALEICELLVRSNAVDVIIVDSVAALVPRAEIEGEMGDSLPGLQARLMSQALRKLTGCIAKSKCTVIFINQIREKIGVMFGSPETTTGGRALKFYASIRIDIRRISAIKEGESNIGNRVRARVVKNKLAPPFREAEFDMMFDEGISTSGDLVDIAVNDKVIDKSGAWFSYGDVRLGQGRENTKRFLRENPDLFEEIRKEVMAKHATTPMPAKAGAAADEDDDE